ncbi:hypothetical protein lerEdw1_015281 [Lerista edwardsae]|nr:hypothetical protein lerEdw1_015281 [Lerista edwardsae]
MRRAGECSWHPPLFPNDGRPSISVPETECVGITDTDCLEEETKEEDPPEKVDTSNTVTSTLTVQEYFAKRMAKLKKIPNRGDAEPADSPPAMAEKLEHLETQSKKKKTPKHLRPENRVGHNGPKMKCPDMLGSSGEEEEEQDTPKRKKAKKSKHLSTGGSLICNGLQHGNQHRGSPDIRTSHTENNDLEEAKSKKKNKKKKLHRDLEEKEDENIRQKKKKHF